MIDILSRGKRASMKPSTLPVTSAWPSGEKRATSGWLFLPNLMPRSNSVGKRSTSSRAPCACPRNRSNAVPGGSRPWCCCLRAKQTVSGVRIKSYQEENPLNPYPNLMLAPGTGRTPCPAAAGPGAAACAPSKKCQG